MKKSIVVVVLAMLIVSACSSSEESSSTTTTSTPLQRVAEFEKCGTIECATIDVPLDYADPDGRQIKIALNRVAARNQGERIGVILVNPGGPGQSGIEFVEQAASFVFPPEVLKKFDIIGWDPRGAGKSSKVECLDDMDVLFDGIDYSPDSQEEFDKMVQVNQELGQRCDEKDAELTRAITTENSVKDMDTIRVALKEEKLNFLGFSYGSALGQIYAADYPDNFRTMVIDGVIDLSLEGETIATDQAMGFENTMGSFFEYCRETSCNFSGSQDPQEAYLDIVQQIDDETMPGRTSGLDLGPAQLDLGTSYYLYLGESGWEELDRGLVGVLNGDPSVILQGFSSYTGRNPQGRYDGSYLSFLSINCSDGNIGGVDDMQTLAESISDKAPVFGESGIYLGIACATWPGTQPVEVLDVEFENDAPIVVIGTTGDPATPFKWARGVSENIDNSVFIRYIGEGHTIYGRGDSCIDDIVNEYFLTAEKPRPQTC